MTKTEVALQRNIEAWVETYPEHQQAGSQLLAQLEAIRTEFERPERARLVGLLSETLSRHQDVHASRQRALDAVERFREAGERMAEQVSSVMRSAKQTRDALVAMRFPRLAAPAPRSEKLLN